MKKRPDPSPFLRARGEYAGGTKVRIIFACCGHTVTQDLAKRHPGVGEFGARFLGRYWGGDQRGVIVGACPKCLPDLAEMGIRGGKKKKPLTPFLKELKDQRKKNRERSGGKNEHRV